MTLDVSQSGTSSPFTSRNRFDELSHLSDNEMHRSEEDLSTTEDTPRTQQPREHKPPPIYVYNVTDYQDMVSYLTATLEEEQYYCKALTDETVKINVYTSDSYRRLIKQFQADNVIHHTYQPRGERAYRVVLRHLHHSIRPEVIKNELEGLGHTARNVLNIRHRLTKAPLPLYFVDLEPRDNNKNIYDLQFLCNMKITVEAPRKKTTIVQCARCQSYGHTKTYCTRPFICVKCGGDHNTTECTKDPTTPAKCALCGGAHPANYKGCEVYRRLQAARGSSPPRPRLSPPRLPAQHVDTGDARQFPPLPQTQLPVPPPKPLSASYSHAVAPGRQAANLGEQLSAFLTEFKTLFSQLMQQTSTILTMLTAVLPRLTP